MRTSKDFLMILLSAGIIFSFLLFADLLLSGQDDGVAVSKMALITCEGSTQIDATPSVVWTALTDADMAQQWCPYWKDAEATHALTKVGQTISYTDNWGNTGKSVVIYAKPNQELRVAHVPDDGSYVCQTKFVLQPNGENTAVTVTEQYSDNLDVPTDRDTAAQVKKEIESYIASLKAVAEKQAASK